MVDVVTSQWLVNGPRYAVGKFTNVSDGTGEAGVIKVDATATGPLGWLTKGNMLYPGIHLTLAEIKFSVSQMALLMEWQATANVDLLALGTSDHWLLSNERLGFAGLTVPPGTPGATGSILFRTVGAAANSTYSVILTFTKNIPNG